MNNTLLKITISALAVTLMYGGFHMYKSDNAPKFQEIDIRQARGDMINATNSFLSINTSKGNIGVEIFEKRAPKTSEAFLDLVSKDFYDARKFISVVKGNVIMSGDYPGAETTSYSLPLEKSPRLVHNEKGILGMYRSQARDGGAENLFYITLGPQPARDGVFTIFGKVHEGLEVLDEITLEDVILDIKVLKN
jgi:peptidyl-prolyl cis-trans isomerase B (cyclophilin B)